MRIKSVIRITCLILVLFLLMVTTSPAEGYGVLDPGVTGDHNVISSSSDNESNIFNSLPAVDEYGNVINPSSDNLGNITNSLPDVDEYGNVINPTSDDLENVMNSLSGDEINVLSETQVPLWNGQTSQVYRITLNCPGVIRLSSSYGTRFTLYAKKNSGTASCPTEYVIRNNYDKVAYGNGRSSYMSLDPGTWCLLVYGSSGSGSFSLRVTSICSNPTPYPTHTPSPCGVYKTDSRQGYLNQGQAAVYGYSIPNGGRSKVEWSMNSQSSPYGDETPVIVASADDSSIESSSSGGTSAFDLYVFKDCNPKNSHCYTRYYSRGPNSYVSIAAPSSGSIYYVMVYARKGSGTYYLKMNSYQCNTDEMPMMASSVMADSLTSTDSIDSVPGSDIPAPSAEVILSEDAG